MQVIIGGAYNGKIAYVKKHLIHETHYEWFEGELPTKSANAVVLTDVHKWLASFTGSENEAIACVLQALEQKRSIVVLTDMSRGIVPINAEDRELRDRAGRLYQALIEKAEEVTQIWYGIPRKLK